jgi:hypothetical protein
LLTRPSWGTPPVPWIYQNDADFTHQIPRAFAGKKAADFATNSLLKTATAGRSPTLLAISAPYTTG